MFGRREAQHVSNVPHKEDQHLDLALLPDISDITTPETENGTTLGEQLEPTTHIDGLTDTDPSNLPTPKPFAPATSTSSPATDDTTTIKGVAESVIGPDDFFDGTYRSERGVRIQGTVRGSIESQQYIFVEAGAQVEANLSAEEITIAGSFHGNIECRQRLIITHSGTIHGKVQTSLLIVQEGGTLDGELHMVATETISINQ
ncbi:MAG: polymer-forming cytoskeletal protein [Chloroflexota bacterium]